MTVKNSGAIMALVARGAVDAWINCSDEKLYDAKKALLESGYQFAYQAIDTAKRVEERVVSFEVLRGVYELINDLDLVLDGVETLSRVVRSVSIQVGGNLSTS